MNLSEILICFNSPIKEEQAWAVCHLCAVSIRSTETESKPCISGLDSIVLNDDGTVDLTGSPCDDETDVSKVFLLLMKIS